MRLTYVRVTLLFASLALLGIALPPLSPDAIYLRARAAVNRLPIPPYIEFIEQNRSQVHSSLEQERLRIIVRTADGHALVQTLRDPEGNIVQSQPRVVADGYVLGTSIYRIGDFPLADFGLRLGPARRPGIFDAPGTPSPRLPIHSCM